LESDEFDASEQTAIKFDLNTWLVGWLVARLFLICRGTGL
jgi:hypothetical protein